MAISTQDFTTLVKNMVASIQGAAKTLVDLSVGSILRSVVEANAAVTLWLQGLILQLLATTRASTSTGTDLDTWVADYGLTRLAAVAASGQVSFARFTSTLQAVVPIGTGVQTGDGSQKYTVTTDATNPNYSATLGGYVLAAGVGSINVPVMASTAGAGANALAGQINTLTTSIPGVDTVTNALAFTNGANAETDAALRARFITFVASLSKATKGAIGYAISSVQTGMSYAIVENYSYAGAYQPGYFYAVVDDGTGAPSAGLLTSVSNAIDAVRPACSSFGVFAPVLQTVPVTMTATIAAGYDATATKLLVKNAVTAYINALQLGQTLAYTKLLQVAYEASAGVTNITAYTLNGGTSDVTATGQQVTKSGTVTVN